MLEITVIILAKSFLMLVHTYKLKKIFFVFCFYLLYQLSSLLVKDVNSQCILKEYLLIKNVQKINIPVMRLASCTKLGFQLFCSHNLHAN